MAIQTFIDDSEGKGQGTYLVLAGLIDTAEAWASFADEWDRRLQASPRIRYFKFSEAGTLTGEFHGLSPDAAKEKLNLLKSVLERQKPSAVWCAVDVREFNELFEPILAVFRGPKLNVLNQPYLWAASQLFEAIYRCVEDRGASERIEIIFDEQDLFKPEVKGNYERVRTNASDSYKEIMPLEPWFKDDKDFVPLQAADLAAGVLRRTLHREEDVPINWRHIFCGMQLELSISKRSMIFNREKLLAIRTEMAKSVLRKMEEADLIIDAES